MSITHMIDMSCNDASKETLVRAEVIVFRFSVSNHGYKPVEAGDGDECLPPSLTLIDVGRVAEPRAHILS